MVVIFGCKYCFANSRGGGLAHEYDEADFTIVEKFFEKAFESDKESKNITVELMRKRVPFHIGGMSDPFQTREIEEGMNWNLKLIYLSNKYQYPLIFSTKRADLPQEYYNELNPKLHAFQISLMGYDNDFIRKYETNTPTAEQRINFIKKLKSKGFWVSVRLQPLIDIDQAIKVCQAVDGICDYITIEHLKIPTDNKVIKELFADIDKTDYYKPSSLRNLELKKEKKIENVNKIKSILKKTKVGCGDNDIHYLSESRCCCGVDTIGEAFDNYLKYNLTYITTEKEKEDLDNLYIPQSNVSSVLNPDTRLVGVSDYKTYVDYYCNCKSDFMCDSCPHKQEFLDKDFSNYKKNKRKTPRNWK